MKFQRGDTVRIIDNTRVYTAIFRGFPKKHIPKDWRTGIMPTNMIVCIVEKIYTPKAYPFLKKTYYSDENLIVVRHTVDQTYAIAEGGLELVKRKTRGPVSKTIDMSSGFTEEEE